jgi:hypothetical protein
MTNQNLQKRNLTVNSTANTQEQNKHTVHKQGMQEGNAVGNPLEQINCFFTIKKVFKYA